MWQFESAVSEVIQRTPHIKSFRFPRPASGVDYLAGQFFFVTIKVHGQDAVHHFSFSSSPTDQGYIEFTKRLSASNFSQKLRDLKPEDEVLLKAPLGNCVFKEEYQKIGFLIGGIGITPVVSIVEYIAGKKLNTDVLLFYSNRSEEETAFKQEFDAWQLQNKNIKVNYIVTEGEPKDKSCILGRLDKNLLADKAKDLAQRMVFIFGPPKMVEAMNALSLELGCLKENIKTENFIGY